MGPQTDIIGEIWVDIVSNVQPYVQPNLLKKKPFLFIYFHSQRITRYNYNEKESFELKLYKVENFPQFAGGNFTMSSHLSFNLKGLFLIWIYSSQTESTLELIYTVYLGKKSQTENECNKCGKGF